MRTDTADIKAVVFASFYPEDREKSTATVPINLEVEIGGIITALLVSPENI